MKKETALNRSGQSQTLNALFEDKK